MEAQGALTRGQEDATAGKVAFGQCAGDRLRHGEQATRGVGGTACRGGLLLRAIGRQLKLRQGEKPAGFVRDIAEFDQPAAFADDVKQIAEF